MKPKVKPVSNADRQKAGELIQHLIEHQPGPRAKEVAKHMNYDAVSILSDVNAFRSKLAKERGMTLEQWIAAEDAVQHPRDILPIQPTERAIARRRMLGAGVPELFVAAVADRAPLDCQAYQDVRKFLDSGDGFRVLAGGRGTRKTGSACWALGQLDKGVFIEAKHITATVLEDKARWTKIMDAPLIVLDDLGWENRDGKSIFANAFSDLLNTVYSRRRRMIITCNITQAQFKTTYGEREYDRLREVGQWSVIKGESVRHYQEREPGEEG